MSAPDPLAFFRLKQIKVARVSEISETTAAASVRDEDRVNFHIGNPLQDPRLSSTFLRIALGIDESRQDLNDSNSDAIMEALGWDLSDRPKLDFLIRTIQKSIPYMPRGGYSRQKPHALIQVFSNWLEHQQEPLQYDLGAQSGRREVILASGGLQETMRMILHTLSDYLQVTPARVLCYHFAVQFGTQAFPNLQIIPLAENEHTARQQVERLLGEQPDTPFFLLIGGLLGEETRRKLRQMSLQSPLFFIEANNAPNHLSLAREARLVQRVIRLLTPEIFSLQFDRLTTVFIAGNADFLSVIENVHFKLKGTPSASEVELLSFLLERKPGEPLLESALQDQPGLLPPDGLETGSSAEKLLFSLAQRLDNYLERAVDRSSPVLEHAISALEQKTLSVSRIATEHWKGSQVDELADLESLPLLDQLIEHASDLDWQSTLQCSFLQVFLKHQPQYRPEACLVLSGSSRTGLGILGFHCGITDVLIPDLSWSYEQCFPNVHAVPLTEELELDVDGMIERLQELLRADPDWASHGALAIDNPHNATGRIFNPDSLARLIIYCLERNIYVIDDLAYQNVAPLNSLPRIKTIRQIADYLVRSGKLDEVQTNRVITVHSMSKTDCLAGARMAVVEIREEALYWRFRTINDQIIPNLAAIFICYLLYRGSGQGIRSYWSLRNRLFFERTQALLTAVNNLPPDRNPFGLNIIPPAGAMYPLLQIKRLPSGLSLDWLASSLARRGVGLLPLGTFARTEQGFDTARKMFRLTLGGSDGAETLQLKTRHLLIDLNRMIAEEDARYNRKRLPVRRTAGGRPGQASERNARWESLARQVARQAAGDPIFKQMTSLPQVDGKALQAQFLNTYLPERLEIFRSRFIERSYIADELVRCATADNGDWLANLLDREFMKDSLTARQERFRLRSYDRTVHPTQRYSLQAEFAFDALIAQLLQSNPVSSSMIEKAAHECLQEFLGRNVSIDSQHEAAEILLDFDALVAAEAYTDIFSEASFFPCLSFWSDWDGSNRPSGQGHQLAASVVMENVRRMAAILTLLRQVDPYAEVDPELVAKLEQLPGQSQRFTALLKDITGLTHQLEQRYRGILPFSVEADPVQRLLVRLHLRRDPARVLWQHNDRYEKKMVDMRRQRRQMLETYFALNKQLRKQLHALIPDIRASRSAMPLLQKVVGYRDLLQRVVITPRIHQGMITARDPFAIDTTAYNMQEINAITGKYGNPGMALALQISMSSKPEALISLDRKMNIQREQRRREFPDAELPAIWLIPLFESVEAVGGIPEYLDRIWDYATQSRLSEQSVQNRFAEIFAEIFIAGSDLSQQISQANGAFQYLKAKYQIQTWLAGHGVAELVRVKLGSGEPMQRQGGYFSPIAGQPAFPELTSHRRQFSAYLPQAAQKSTEYAVTPLQGVFLGGDLRTFQSCLSEQLRYLPVAEYADLLYHMRETQQVHRDNLVRAAETITQSRLGAQSRSIQELERLTIGVNDAIYAGFLQELTEHFRHILYGRPEDVVGIHIISYFIGRSMPQLRDRPTSRARSVAGADRGQQILANVAEIIPLSRQGSLLRAIAHNQAQTGVLGINQLTTGLFRALEYYSQKAFPEAERERMITERILPRLPVYEILNTLRLYQDWNGEFIQRIETAFPAGNSAFVALREDRDAMQRYLPYFQQELLRRHGLNVNDFLSNATFIPELLPALRPDLAVLLQADLFNRDPNRLLKYANGSLDQEWARQVSQILKAPDEIHTWRSIIWDVLGDSIYKRVQSFTELATALYSFSSTRSFSASSNVSSGRIPKLSSSLSGYVRTSPANDDMRQFLVGAVEYLNSFTEGSIEIPVSVIRALNDVENIALIEESALPPAKQDVLRYAMLQIARIAGDNG